jgi:CP family cyanate transporter-like MFS transporter
VWTLPAVGAMIVWSRARERTVIEPVPRAALWRRPLAWAVALFMGIQSMAFYATLSWLPSILEAEGRSPEAAGALLALTAIVSLPTAFYAPVLGSRMRSQTGLMLAIVLVPTVGVIGLIAAPGAYLLWIVLVGTGQGAALGMGMMLPLLRGGDANTSASLTAMTLTVGYIVAAFGPWILGAAHDVAGGWTVPLFALLAMTLGQLPAGLLAARPRTIAKNGA